MQSVLGKLDKNFFAEIVTDLWQVGGSPQVPMFTQPIKQTDQLYLYCHV
jgi:hypothetical protein